MEKINHNYKMSVNFNSVLFDNLLDYLRPKSGEKILDMGCHRGFYVKAMEGYTKEIIGIDIDRVSLEKAVTDKVKYDNAMNLSFAENSFDKIYSLHTIEHIPNPQEFFSEGARILKPGGKAVVVYPFEFFRGFGGVIVSACVMYRNPFMARKMHLHRFTPGKIKKIIKNTSFRHIKSRLIFTLFPPALQYLTILEKEK